MSTPSISPAPSHRNIAAGLGLALFGLVAVATIAFLATGRGTGDAGSSEAILTRQVILVVCGLSALGLAGGVWLAVRRDLAGRALAEARLAGALAELAQERARLKFIFDALPVGVSYALTTADGTRNRLINDAHLHICGLTRAEADDPDAFRRISHPDDRERQAALHRPLDREKQGGYTIDKRYLRPDGQVLWVMLAFQRHRLENGGYEDLSVVVDITERKRAEETIDHQNRSLQAVFESLPGLFLVLRPDFTIVTATDAYVEASMTSREAIQGKLLFDVFPDNPVANSAAGPANLRSSLERVLQTGATDAMAIQRYDVRRPDGVFEERYWSPINSPVIGPDNTLEYIIHRVEDVTAFVRQREATASHDTGAIKIRMEQMEAEVFRSTQNLQTANRQLETANAELEAFSYSVSHDLRAPLRHIHGYAAMLVRESSPHLSATAKRHLQVVMDSSRHMGTLIDDLLTFSKMSRVGMQETQIDLVEMAGGVRQELVGSSPERAIEWTIGPLPPVVGDTALIRLVLVNLLGNAFKYTRGRDPARIEFGCQGVEQGRAVLFVRDNGAGFDMKYAHKLFGVFQRLHRMDEFEGTGIGLATVRRIVARHGGRTWAEGAVGSGATFSFTLALAPSVTDTA